MRSRRDAPADSPAGHPGRLAVWAAAPLRPVALGVRPIDALAMAAVIAAVQLNNATATGAGQHPLTATAYAWSAVVGVPVLLRHRWPRGVLVACSILLLLFYSLDQRDISPAPLLCLPLYDAAAAGYLVVAVIIPVYYMVVGLFVVGSSTHQSLLSLATEFLPSVIVLLLAVLLGDAVRSRRALAAQTRERLRLADEDRERDGVRRVADERLRIARELHDTVAHSMATITVQAASALHVLDAAGDTAEPAAQDRGVRAALAAIRDTSKSALTDIRITLRDLRTMDGDMEPGHTRAAGLARLDALCEAVRAAGAPVVVTVDGEPAELPPNLDHCAYRILQESLTNVLRHAGAAASAAVRLEYAPALLTIEVRDDGPGNGATARDSASDGQGHEGQVADADAPRGGPPRGGPPRGGPPRGGPPAIRSPMARLARGWPAAGMG